MTNNATVAPIAQESLIPVFSGEIAGISAQLVDARALHNFLESKQQFGNWIQNRIEEYKFTQDIDFVVINKFIGDDTAFGGKRKSKEYHLSLDMAKELGMVERNDKGRQIRRYFIEIERAALTKAPQYGLKDLASPYISEAEATRFKKSIEQHCKSNSKSYAVLYRKVYEYYGITSYKHIPSGKLAEAAQLCGMALVALAKPRMPKEQQLVTMTQAELDALVNDRVAKALPAPAAEFPPEVLAAVERRAQLLSLRQYEHIKKQIWKTIDEHNDKHDDTAALVAFIDHMGLPDSQVVIVHRNTLWRLTSRLSGLESIQQQAMTAIHALEDETGVNWYGRN